jgi:hypothetical protein
MAAMRTVTGGMPEATSAWAGSEVLFFSYFASIAKSLIDTTRTSPPSRWSLAAA